MDNSNITIIILFFNNMSGALKFAMNQIVMESYRYNESRIKSISNEIKELLEKEARLKLPIFVFEQNLIHGLDI